MAAAQKPALRFSTSFPTCFKLWLTEQVSKYSYIHIEKNLFLFVVARRVLKCEILFMMNHKHTFKRNVIFISFISNQKVIPTTFDLVK